MTKTKKIFVVAVVCAAMLVLVVLILPTNVGYDTELIRIHIVANSDRFEDQRVKLEVRDAITNKLNVLLQGAKDRGQVYAQLQKLQGDIKLWTDNILLEQGMLYKSSVEIDNEYFPTRIYEGIVVESGYYDALMITLGDGAGQNWWCVVYPPLCFISDAPSDYWEYRSFLLQWWNNFWGR